MWKKPITHGKTTESKYAYDSKLVYCIAKLKDHYNELDIQTFADTFPQILDDIGFEWKHRKKGKLRTPSADQIRNNWYHLNKWEACSKAYAEDILGPQKEQAKLIYDKKLLEDTIKDFKLIDDLRDRIDFLLEKQKSEEVKYDYQIAKNEETINSIWHRIRERLGLDIEDVIENPHLEIPVFEDPVWLDQEKLKEKRDYLWGIIDE